MGRRTGCHRSGGRRRELLTPDLAAAEPVILHDMGATLTSVQGFSELIIRAPDHPDRERYLALVASEARKGVEALRDLQLVRALLAGDLREKVEPLDLGEIVAVAGIEGASALDGVTITADRHLLEEILTRCSQAGPGTARVEGETGRIVIDLEEGDVESEVMSWRAQLRPFALALHVLPAWGLGVLLESEPAARAVLITPR